MAEVTSGFNAALANSSQNGVAVDTRGFRNVAAVIDIVTGASTTAQVKIQESADGSTGWTDITGSTTPSTAQVASQPGSGIGGVPYIINISLAAPRLRYLRVVVIGTGTAGQAVVDFVLFNAYNSPPTQANTATTL